MPTRSARAKPVSLLLNVLARTAAGRQLVRETRDGRHRQTAEL